MILCCGEALIDMLPRQSAEGEACFAPYPGGAVFNTAVALGRLGAPVAFFSGVSTDFMGEILVGALAAARVETRHLARSDRPTTLAFVTLAEGQARYVFHDEGTAGRQLDVGQLPVLPAGVEALFFGGISLVREPAAASYEALQARAAGERVTMLDPNIRPGFIGDREAAYRTRLGRMLARADIVKFSDEDLRWLAGDGDSVALARGILALGPKLVFVTEGAAGARAITATRERFCAAPPVSVVDTVGAGDTFNAGVLAALHGAGALGKAALADPPEAVLDAALGLGVRAAAVTVGRAGANPPWRDEL